MGSSHNSSHGVAIGDAETDKSKLLGADDELFGGRKRRARNEKFVVTANSAYADDWFTCGRTRSEATKRHSRSRKQPCRYQRGASFAGS